MFYFYRIVVFILKVITKKPPPLAMVHFYSCKCGVNASLQQRQMIIFRRETCRCFVPVHHVPELFNVVRTAVLEFQVVSMFHTSRPTIGKPEAPEMASPISGESWLAVETTASLSPFCTSHAQPEPKREAAAFSNSALKLSTEPKSRSIAAFRSPCRVVPFSDLSRTDCG